MYTYTYTYVRACKEGEKDQKRELRPFCWRPHTVETERDEKTRGRKNEYN